MPVWNMWPYWLDGPQQGPLGDIIAGVSRANVDSISISADCSQINLTARISPPLNLSANITGTFSTRTNSVKATVNG